MVFKKSNAAADTEDCSSGSPSRMHTTKCTTPTSNTSLSQLWEVSALLMAGYTNLITNNMFCTPATHIQTIVSAFTGCKYPYLIKNSWKLCTLKVVVFFSFLFRSLCNRHFVLFVFVNEFVQTARYNWWQSLLVTICFSQCCGKVFLSFMSLGANE